jgi:hypothetical protein
MAPETSTSKRPNDQPDPPTAPNPKKSKTMPPLESSIAFGSLEPSLLFEAFQSSISIPIQKAHIWVAYSEVVTKPDSLPTWLRWTKARTLTAELLTECLQASTLLPSRPRYEDLAQAAVTFGAVRRKATIAHADDLALEAANREMVYLILMLLRCTYGPRPNLLIYNNSSASDDRQLHLIPGYLGQVEAALSVMERSLPASNAASLPVTRVTPAAEVSGTVPAEDDNLAHIRLRVKSQLRNLQSEDVFPLSKLFGVANAVRAFRRLERTNRLSSFLPKLVSGGGILLHGVQGTGKTALATGFAKEVNWSFYDITAASIYSKFMGESESFLEILFNEAERTAPSIIFIDEIDSVLKTPTEHDAIVHLRVQNVFKKLWSDVLHRRIPVYIVGATNRPHLIDLSGFGRRFKTKIHVGLPNEDALFQIIKSLSEDTFHTLDREEMLRLAHLSKTKWLTGNDLQVIHEELCVHRIDQIEFATRFSKVRHCPTLLSWNQLTIQMTYQGRDVFVPWMKEDNLEFVEKRLNDFAEPEIAVKYRPFHFSDWRAEILAFKSTITAKMWDENEDYGARHSSFAA